MPQTLIISIAVKFEPRFSQPKLPPRFQSSHGDPNFHHLVVTEISEMSRRKFFWNVQENFFEMSWKNCLKCPRKVFWNVPEKKSGTFQNIFPVHFKKVVWDISEIHWSAVFSWRPQFPLPRGDKDFHQNFNQQRLKFARLNSARSFDLSRSLQAVPKLRSTDQLCSGPAAQEKPSTMQ